MLRERKCVIQSDQSQAGYERWRSVQKLCKLENGWSVELRMVYFEKILNNHKNFRQFIRRTTANWTSTP